MPVDDGLIASPKKQRALLQNLANSLLAFAFGFALLAPGKAAITFIDGNTEFNIFLNDFVIGLSVALIFAFVPLSIIYVGIFVSYPPLPMRKYYITAVLVSAFIGGFIFRIFYARY